MYNITQSRAVSNTKAGRKWFESQEIQSIYRQAVQILPVDIAASDNHCSPAGMTPRSPPHPPPGEHNSLAGGIPPSTLTVLKGRSSDFSVPQPVVASSIAYLMFRQHCHQLEPNEKTNMLFDVSNLR